MSQRIWIITPKKPRKPKGVAISKKSIGTIWINGVPHTYNSDLVYNNPVTIDKIVKDSQPKPRVIIIRRK